MAIANIITHTKVKLLERFLPKASAAEAETFEILMDLDQISTLLASFDDVQRGRIVTADQAFGDL